MCLYLIGELEVAANFPLRTACIEFCVSHIESPCLIEGGTGLSHYRAAYRGIGNNEIQHIVCTAVAKAWVVDPFHPLDGFWQQSTHLFD